MSRTLLAGCRVLIDGRIVAGHAVLLDGSRIAAVLPVEASVGDATRLELPQQALLAPGFIDVQVNGGGGVQFNDDPSAAAIRAIASAHRRFGTTGLLPTLITDDPALTPRAVAAVAELQGAPAEGVLGLHLEGPFINPSRPGVHAPRYIRAPLAADLALLADAARRLRPGRLLVTLAPEMLEAAALAALVSAGVVLSAGHSVASFEQARAGFAAGVSGVTHLFNAMPGPAGRAPGLATAALLDTAVHAGLIADFVHVHPALLQLALASPAGPRLLLVTDAMAPAGTTLDRFTLNGRTIRRAAGRLETADGTLAGADTTMIACVRNAAFGLGLGLERAIAMASSVPAGWLGLQDRLGRIAAGLQADLVLLSSAANVIGTWRAGLYEDAD